MQRSELEHIIRASGDIAEDDEIIIVGSQSILGQFPDAPMRLLVSMEAELQDTERNRISSKIRAMFSS